VLSALQRIAFETFQRAGAPLSDDFTDAELRGEFRRLARETHPDVHPDATCERRTRLAVHFAEVRDAYEQLLKTRK
jgi:DnaJ-class molecular chaperone